MQLLNRAILAVVMTSVMVFMVTLIVTLLNIGLRADFAAQWAKAYFIAWPIAAITAFFFTPAARRITDAVIKRIG
jgi:hypothetical protein